MTDPLIYDLGMTDTEYAALVAKGYNPALERKFIEVGETHYRARKLTQLVGLLQDKPLETEQEWEEFMSLWEACRERPNSEEQGHSRDRASPQYSQFLCLAIIRLLLKGKL